MLLDNGGHNFYVHMSSFHAVALSCYRSRIAALYVSVADVTMLGACLGFNTHFCHTSTQWFSLWGGGRGFCVDNGGHDFYVRLSSFHAVALSMEQWQMFR